MHIHCQCGTDFETKELPCPDGREGCMVSHPDPASFICPSCGENSGPKVAQAFREGNVREEIGIAIFNPKGLERLTIVKD